VFYAQGFADNEQGKAALERLNHNTGTLFHYVERIATSFEEMIRGMESGY
jgi:hypothetical protein